MFEYMGDRLSNAIKKFIKEGDEITVKYTINDIYDIIEIVN